MSDRVQTKRQKVVRTLIYVFAAIAIAAVIAAIVIGQLPPPTP